MNFFYETKDCPLPEDNSDTVFTDLATELIEKIQSFEIFPKTFTETELKSMAYEFLR
ncbi:MAG TPA: hypothetical protein PLG05_04185 [Bacteroidales bacterium]|nr:hypothetical protein [Bacteroidales bacterium]HPL04353.1 hypothetical protein [Bacteroidales bacterium]